MVGHGNNATQQRGAASNQLNSSNAASGGGSPGGESPSSNELVVARNMRSMEVCCSAALADLASSSSPQQDQLALLQQQFVTRAPVCLRHRLARLFGSERMADVHFILNSSGSSSSNSSSNTMVEQIGQVDGTGASGGADPATVRVPAHRLLLSVASPVFDAMFNSQMAVIENGDVNIPDVELPAFMALLRFIYTDQVELTPETVMSVLYASKKYAVDSLQERCVEFLRSKLSKENAFLLLGQARLFDEPQLASLCLDVIDRHTNEAMATESFLEIDADTMCAVLQRDTLCIRENRIFSHVHRWAEHECARLSWELTSENKRRALGPALQLIRFPLMTPEEFANDAAQTGLLENSELVSLFLWYLATPKPTNGNLPIFSIQPRCCTAGRELTASRFQHVELRWGYSGTADKIKFTVSRPIYIVGLGLYGSVTTGSHYSTVIQLIHCESREVRGQNEVEYETDGSKKPYLVRFSEPVAVDADTPYLASATIRGPDTYYGTRGQRRVVVELTQMGAEANSGSVSSNSDVTMGEPNNNASGEAASSSHANNSSSSVTFQFSYACSSNNGTSVEDGQIPDIVFFA